MVLTSVNSQEAGRIAQVKYECNRMDDLSRNLRMVEE